MVSYSRDEIIILAGTGDNGYGSCEVNIHSTANESLNGISQTKTIVDKNAKGHIFSTVHGNEVAKVADGHVVFLGRGCKLLEFKASTRRLDIIKQF